MIPDMKIPPTTTGVKHARPMAPPKLSIADLKKQEQNGLPIDSFQPARRELLRKVDALGNRDGRVSTQEISAYQKQLIGGMDALAKTPPTVTNLIKTLKLASDFGKLTAAGLATRDAQTAAGALAVLAGKIDGVVKSSGKRIGDGDGYVTSIEVTMFMDEMKRRAAETKDPQARAQFELLGSGGQELLDMLGRHEQVRPNLPIRV